jgi:hypothetical protein
MDKIINILLLIIIFVFDPLAISLVIAANFAFEKAYPKKKYKQNLYGEEVEEKISIWDTTLQDGLEDIEVKDAEEIKTQDEFLKNLDNLEKIRNWEKAEKRMNIIGQNGNDGDHYEEEYNILDTNQDGIVDQSEIEAAKQKIKSLYSQLNGGISSWRRNKIQTEIDHLQNQLPKDDDQTKTY